MKKTTFLPALYLAALSASLGLTSLPTASFAQPSQTVELTPENRPSFQRSDILIAGKDHPTEVFNVEVALSALQTRYGLMFVEEMAANEGMIFIFPHDIEAKFWMKNTLIPLDLLFIDSQGCIVNIHERAIPHDLTSIKSVAPVRAVLELNGGTAEALGLSAGDVVQHPFFKSLDKESCQ